MAKFKRTTPILGYSPDGNFVFDENSYPSGLKFWINDATEQIYTIQNSNKEQSESEKHVWEYVQKSESFGLKPNKSAPPEECYEHEEIYTKGPLMNTLWYQTGVFNDDLPSITCNGYSFQINAGCVPIAMAQVMKYYQYPTNYNWASMPLTYGTTTTANFIKDIHDAIRNVYSGQPTYDCNGTYVSNSADMGNVLKTKFNYTSAT